MKFWKTNTVTYTNHNTNITAHSLQHLLLYSTVTYVTNNTDTYYIDTDEIPGFFHLRKNHNFTARSEDTIFIFHV